MRRNRRDLQSRDYGCPCGKAYLSYPALYTHIKKYHQMEDNMLENATMPLRNRLKRGRPKDTSAVLASQGLEELTMFETAILKIYEELAKVIHSPIMLEGNSEIDPEVLQSKYAQVLLSVAHLYSHFATERDVRQSEAIIGPIADGLTKHFAVDVAVRVKLMMLAGYLQRHYNSTERKQCVTRMSLYGWEQAGTRAAQIIYDILMQSLQQRGHSELIVLSPEE